MLSKMSKPQTDSIQTVSTNSKAHTSTTITVSPSQHDNKEEDNKSAILAYVATRSHLHLDYMNFLITLIHIPSLPTLVLEYAYLYDIIFYDLVVCPITKISKLDFYNKAEPAIAAYKQAEAIARNFVLTAGPLDKLETEVRNNPTVLLPQIRITMTLSDIELIFEGTLLQLSIILLDNNIMRQDIGQTKVLMNLTKELLPKSMPLTIEQARLALFDEDEKVKKARKAEQSKVLDNAIDEIKQDNIEAAREIIMNHIKSTKPAVITNKNFFFNLLEFLEMAFRLLSNKYGYEEDNLNEEQALKYCLATIGMINRVVPFKLRKTLRIGLYHLDCQGFNFDRNIDVSDSVFLGDSTPNKKLGFDCYYEDRFLVSKPDRCLRIPIMDICLSYINNYIQSAKSILRSYTSTESTVAPTSTNNTTKAHDNSAATSSGSAASLNTSVTTSSHSIATSNNSIFKNNRSTSVQQPAQSKDDSKPTVTSNNSLDA